ncbi:MAG: hypothetical protein ACRD3E_06440 [Terriglobales bacterium]
MPGITFSPRRYVIVLVIAACMFPAVRVAAQVTDTRELQSYLTAITSPNSGERTGRLRGFLEAWPQSSLRRDALEWLAWDNHLSDRNESVASARELLTIEAANPLAAAIVMDNQPQASGDKTYDAAQSAIGKLASMRPPAGMGAPEFYRVRQFATAALCDTVGTIELQRKDYSSARDYLRRAATLAPHDARYAYSLGLADLSGNKPDAAEGYMYMARAVNLAQGTAAAHQIDQYARGLYEKEGGKPGDWDRFLAAAVIPGSPAVVSAPATEASAAGHEAAAPSASSPGIAEAPAVPATTADVTPPKVVKPATPLPKVSDLPAPKTEEGELADLGLPGPDAAHRQPFRPGAPVSLGILIESSLVNGYKKDIVNTLTDLVRRLAANEQNEAFVLSFDKSIAFRQDLTGDPRALEHAIAKIKPNNGTALLDAVTMAAFQLNRVSRAGNNRVLLVISDGRNLDSKMPPLMATSQLESGAVRVDCIGVGALDTSGELLLQTLAGRSGGEARFTDSSGIRQAAHEMAANFGVQFSF